MQRDEDRGRAGRRIGVIGEIVVGTGNRIGL